METIGSPPVMAYQHLYGYLPRKIAFMDLPFDLSCQEAISVYTSHVDQLIKRVSKGDLKGFVHIAACNGFC